MLSLLLASILSATQAPVDFSGRWRLVAPEPGAPAELLFVSSAADMFWIERHMADGVVGTNYTTNPSRPGLEARWVGATLVLLERGNGGRGAAPPTPDREETWSIDAAGRLHVATSVVYPRAQPIRSQLTYERTANRGGAGGENLLDNPDADLATAGWQRTADATVEPCDGNPCFVVRNQGAFRQTIPLPAEASGRFVVLIGSGWTERVEPDAITGLPYLYGVAGSGNRILGYFQGQHMLGRPAVPRQWVAMSGVFQVPPGTERLNFQAQIAQGQGVPQNGSAARFDDLGCYLFPTEAEARTFISNWRGTRGADNPATETVVAARPAPPRPAPPRLPPPPPGDNVSRDVHVTLSIRDGKTVFRSGDPIRLVLTFTADRPGYAVNQVVARMAPWAEDVEITPATDVARWLDEYRSSYRPDYAFTADPFASPVEVTLPLNYIVRFDSPGEYTVRLRTPRAGPTGLGGAGRVLLETNPVTFTIVPMTADEEAAAVERLAARLDASPRCDTPLDAETCDELAFLAGEPATREKLRRYLDPPVRNAGRWWEIFRMGLFISRDAAPAIAMLDARHRDLSLPADQIPLLSELRIWSELPALTARAIQENTALATLREARLAEVRQGYMADALASLPHRTGNARRLTGLAMLQLLVPSPRPPTPVSIPAAVRQAVVEEFAGFGDFDAGSILQNYWPYVRGPEMLPHVVRLAASRDSWPRAQALGPLVDLDPDRARPIFVAEMLVGRLSMVPDVLLRLPDATLPEIEQPLLRLVDALRSGPRAQQAFLILRQKLTFLARYGTRAIRAEMQRFYADWQRDPTDRSLGAVLEDYLSRYGSGSRAPQ
jgi:hypothetical protein